MSEIRGESGFSLKPRNRLRVKEQVRRKHLERDGTAVQFRVHRAVDHAKPAPSEFGEDFIFAERMWL
jgi:hypothetical protein